MPVNPLYPDCWRPEGNGGPNVCAWRHSHQEEKPRRTSPTSAQGKLVAPETPGARLPARDVGGSLGHSPSLPLSQRKGLRLGISLQVLPVVDWRREGSREKEKRTQTTSSHGPQHRCQSCSSALGECARAPVRTSSWPLPKAQQRGPLGGDCMFPRMQLVTGTQASSRPVGSSDHPLSKAWVPSVLFPIWCPHHLTPMPEPGLPDSASWRADRWKCLLSAMLGLSVHL